MPMNIGWVLVFVECGGMKNVRNHQMWQFLIVSGCTTVYIYLKIVRYYFNTRDIIFSICIRSTTRNAWYHIICTNLICNSVGSSVIWVSGLVFTTAATSYKIVRDLIFPKLASVPF